jgi:hypothetical protein
MSFAGEPQRAGRQRDGVRREQAHHRHERIQPLVGGQSQR